MAIFSPCAVLRHTAKTNVRCVLYRGTWRILTASYGNQRPLALAHVEPASPCALEWAHDEVCVCHVPCVAFSPCGFDAAHGKSDFHRVPERLRTVKFLAHGKLLVSGSAGMVPYQPQTGSDSGIKLQPDHKQRKLDLRFLITDYIYSSNTYPSNHCATPSTLLRSVH